MSNTIPSPEVVPPVPEDVVLPDPEGQPTDVATVTEVDHA